MKVRHRRVPQVVLFDFIDPHAVALGSQGYLTRVFFFRNGPALEAPPSLPSFWFHDTLFFSR